MKIILFVLIIAVFGVTFFLLNISGDKNQDELYTPPITNNKESQSLDHVWEFDSGKWKATREVPQCPTPLTINSPVDVNLASGIIYPGQIRGGDYKPHGGFRFDTLNTNHLNVYAPIDANLVKAARLLEEGEIQYALYFISDCGIMYKLDHLAELTDELLKVLEHIPTGAEGDSRTTPINPPFYVSKGEQLATKVGFENFQGRKNVFFDFGLYDLRKTNGIVYDDNFRSKHTNVDEYGTYGVCWFDNLPEPDELIVRNLPAGGMEGKTSDYC